MTDPQPSAESSAAPQPGSGSPSEARSAKEGGAKEGSADARADGVPGGQPRAAGGRELRQSLVSTAGTIGNWLASLGWGKFFLLILLMLAALSLADEMFSSRRGPRHPPDVPVEVKVTVDSNGLHIARPSGAPKGAKTEGHAGGQAQPKVRIDEKGVRVETDKNGQKSTVVIDHQGVHIEREPSATGK